MVFCYNRRAVGDVLLIVVGNSEGKEVVANRKNAVTQVVVKETQEIVAWNIFTISQILPELTGNGQIDLTQDQLQKVNQEVEKAGFSEKIKGSSPKIVTGYVRECVKHPDSDHLSITQTEVGEKEVLQIICGAPNIKEGLKVVVAKPGAMMPDGSMIWPGKLRGEESHGMICSARELGIPNAPTKKGILELSSDTEIGQPFVIE